MPWSAVVAGLLGAGLGAVILALQLKAMIINPDAISQSYDNIFHLNAVRWIQDTGDASSLSLGGMTTADGSPSFYPGAWHGLVSLVFGVTGVSIPAATNAVTFAVAAVAWPLSAVGLAAALPGRSRALLAAVGVLSACFIAYPGLLLKWGILYPNLLGFAILPGFLAVLIGVLRWVRGVGPGAGTAWQALPLILLLCAGGAGLGLAHPNGVTAAAVLLLPLLLGLMVRELLALRGAGSRATAGAEATAEADAGGTGGRGARAGSGSTDSLDAGTVPASRATHLIRAGLFGVAVLVVLAIWWKVRPPAENASWPPTLTDGQAVGEFLLQSFTGHEALWLLAALILAGAVRAVRRAELRWIVGAWLVSGLLWVAVTSMQEGPLRSFLSGPWYNDSFRLAALTAVPSVLLAGLGLSWIPDLLLRARTAAGTAPWSTPARDDAASRPETTSGAGRPALAWGLTAVMLLAGWGLSTVQPLHDAQASVAREFEVKKDSLLLTEDELNVLERLDDYVPEGGVVVVNPWEGSALAYALEGRSTTMRHTLAATPQEYAAVLEGLDDAEDPAEQAAACRIVEDDDARWYLDFEDTLQIGAHAEEQFRGIDDLVDSGMVEPLYTSGPVGLYEITGCEANG